MSVACPNLECKGHEAPEQDICALLAEIEQWGDSTERLRETVYQHLTALRFMVLGNADRQALEDFLVKFSQAVTALAPVHEQFPEEEHP